MDESTTRKLSDVLSNIDNTRDMEKFMEEPKVTDSFRVFLSTSARLMLCRRWRAVS